jgi:hypothetical protein
MGKWTAIILSCISLNLSACRSRPAPPPLPAASMHAPTAWTGAPPVAHTRGAVGGCATTLAMQYDRVVVRSGGCPGDVNPATTRLHHDQVEAAVRSLEPGEEMTVETTLP